MGLYRFLVVKKPKLYAEIESMKNDIISIILNNKKVLDNTRLMVSTSDMMKNYNEQHISKTKLLSDNALLLRNKESFKEIAECGALLFKVAQSMSCIQNFYTVDWAIFLSMYDRCIEKFNCTAQKAICNEIIHYVYNQIH